MGDGESSGNECLSEETWASHGDCPKPGLQVFWISPDGPLARPKWSGSKCRG